MTTPLNPQIPPHNLRRQNVSPQQRRAKKPIIQAKKTHPSTCSPHDTSHLPPNFTPKSTPLTFCDSRKSVRTAIKPKDLTSAKNHKIIIKKFIKNFIVLKPHSNNQLAAHLFITAQPYHTFQDLHSILAMLNVTRRPTDVKKIQYGMQMNTTKKDGNGCQVKASLQAKNFCIPGNDPIVLYF